MTDNSTLYIDIYQDETRGGSAASRPARARNSREACSPACTRGLNIDWHRGTNSLNGPIEEGALVRVCSASFKCNIGGTVVPVRSLWLFVSRLLFLRHTRYRVRLLCSRRTEGNSSSNCVGSCWVQKLGIPWVVFFWNCFCIEFGFIIFTCLPRERVNPIDSLGLASRLVSTLTSFLGSFCTLSTDQCITYNIEVWLKKAQTRFVTWRRSKFDLVLEIGANSTWFLKKEQTRFGVRNRIKFRIYGKGGKFS